MSLVRLFLKRILNHVSLLDDDVDEVIIVSCAEISSTRATNHALYNHRC